MQLSPLQSRLVASLAATSCLLLLYFLLLAPKGAFAYEPALDSLSGSSPWPDLSSIDSVQEDDTEPQSSFYEPILNFLGRSILGRAGDTTPLENDKPLGSNIQAGETPTCYVIKKDSLIDIPFFARQVRDDGGDDDDDGKSSSNGGRKDATIYISANTCLLPIISSGNSSSSSSDGGGNNSNNNNNNKSPRQPPQMILFLSNGTDLGCPQITNSTTGEVTKGFTAHKFEQGAVTVNVTNVTSDIYVGIYAPNIEDSFTGWYGYEVAASSIEYFHQYRSNEAELLWMDSDSTAALLITRNLTHDASETRRIWSEGPMYRLFVSGPDPSELDGLRRSACGLEKYAHIGTDNYGYGLNNSIVKTSMTLRGPGGLPKQQFYIVGLNATTSYDGVLVRPANVTVNAGSNPQGAVQVPWRRPGSVVFQRTSFQTSAAPNCKVVTDLEFCDEIQYAVPGNDGKYNNTELAKAYDLQAKSMYDNFLKVMQQIPCEADRTSRYSLARTCDDCKRAYKRWLCTVSLPRCEDLHTSSPFSVIRNVNQALPNGTFLPAELRQKLGRVPSQNASRSSFIDQTIRPGPYYELLPCEDICYQVVQSCPAAIQFQCPQPGMHGFNVTYGVRSRDNTVVSCNYPGEARTRISGGTAAVPDLALVTFVTTLFGLLMMGA
ncbi:hypothetical protein E4U42_005389 [Claviceps africana]|uniref:Uncharacterized protein n=1 Tax=Claviceps africana TaxID=83212 RepID=A0A8K0JD33_9HYPO|nr:hypothetical protein E4U42_005389 [Claviceps africana]